MKKIKSFEEACQLTGKDPGKVLPYANPQNEWEEALNAMAMMWVIIEAINEGWIADFSNSDRKYYPWFDISSGSGLSYFVYCVGARSATVVGSRLCCDTYEKAEYVGKTFIDIYAKFLTQKTVTA